jgi:hypothetical protein
MFFANNNPVYLLLVCQRMTAAIAVSQKQNKLATSLWGLLLMTQIRQAAHT